ncbi:hypothetical protein ACSQ67_024172 [Phaseolus vulgaris]
MLIHGISVSKPPPDYITYLVPDWKNSQSRIPITPTQKTPSRKQISLEGKSKKQIQQALEDYLSTLASDEEDEEVFYSSWRNQITPQMIPYWIPQIPVSMLQRLPRLWPELDPSSQWQTVQKLQVDEWINQNS